MSDLKTIAREAAHEAHERGGNTYDLIDAVADAVTVAVGNEWARYRPQHAEECEINRCANCGEWKGVPIAHRYGDRCDDWQPRPCSCGLDSLLASLDGGASAPVPSAESAKTENIDHIPIGPGSGYDDEEDFGAGLIGQVAADMEGTLPRPNAERCRCGHKRQQHGARKAGICYECVCDKYVPVDLDDLKGIGVGDGGGGVTAPWVNEAHVDRVLAFLRQLGWGYAEAQPVPEWATRQVWSVMRNLGAAFGVVQQREHAAQVHLQKTLEQVGSAKDALRDASASPGRSANDHGGTRLTEGDAVSVLVPAPELPHDVDEDDCREEQDNTPSKGPF